MAVRERGQLAARAWFALCRAAGRLLKSGRYAQAHIVGRDGDGDGARQVRKRRAFYAPLLIWMGGPLMRLLGTGVRVLPMRAWEARERQIQASLRDRPIRIEADGTLVLPYLAGETLAAVLANPARDERARTQAIALAVVALADFHHEGFTHGDATAENVIVDLDTGVASGAAAHWFDFETVHDPHRPMVWRRADDVRALLFSCAIRVLPGQRAGVVHLVLDRYGNDEVVRVLATQVASVWRRALTYHLAQASMSFDDFQDIVWLLRAHAGI